MFGNSFSVAFDTLAVEGYRLRSNARSARRFFPLASKPTFKSEVVHEVNCLDASLRKQSNVSGLTVTVGSISTGYTRSGADSQPQSGTMV